MSNHSIIFKIKFFLPFLNKIKYLILFKKVKFINFLSLHLFPALMVQGRGAGFRTSEVTLIDPYVPSLLLYYAHIFNFKIKIWTEGRYKRLKGVPQTVSRTHPRPPPHGGRRVKEIFALLEIEIINYRHGKIIKQQLKDQLLLQVIMMLIEKLLLNS